MAWFPSGWFPLGWFDEGILYTRGAYGSLPSDSGDLITAYTDADKTNVATVDGIMVSQSASSQYAIHEFKNDASGKSTCTVTWTGQNSMGNTAGYPTILEIYNTNTNLWEELDRDTSTVADTNFTLSFPILSGLDNYKDTNGIITCRVYQSSIGR